MKTMKKMLTMNSRLSGLVAATASVLLLGGCPLLPPEDPALLDYTGGDNDPSLGVASVTITAHGSTSLEMGGTVQLSAVAYNGVGQQLTVEFQWTSSNSSIASVNQSGVVTAKSTAGSCVVSACAGGKCDEVNIVVTAPAIPVQSVVLSSGGGENVLQLGETRSLSVLITYTDGTTSTDTNRVTFGWGTSGVVSITNAGVLTAVGLGTTGVTALAGGVTSNSLSFTSEAASIAISCDGKTAVAAGTSVACSVVARDVDDNLVQGLGTGSFSLTSEQQGTLISNIAANGTVTTLASGDGTATLNASHTTASTQRTLNATYQLDVVRITGLSIDGATTDLVAGGARTFTATLTRQGGGAVPSGMTVTWELSNPQIAHMSFSQSTTVGEVNATGVGGVELTAFAGSASDVVNFRTVPASVTLTGSTEVNAGSTTQLSATAFTSSGAAATVANDATIAWQTSASGVATIASAGISSGSPRGTVTGVSAGSATLTVTVNGVSDTHDLTVVNVSQFPSFAGIVSATRTGTTTVQLAWAAATDAQSPSSALVYEVRRSSTGPANWDAIPAVITTSAGATSANDTVPMRGETYTYNVRAVDPQGNRDSNTATANVFMPDANPAANGGVPYLVGGSARWASVSGTTLTEGRILGPVVEPTSTTKEITAPRFLADGKLVGIRVAEGDQQKVYVRNDDGSFTDIATVTVNTGATAGVSTPGIAAAFGLFGSNADKIAYTKDSSFAGKVDLVVYDRDSAATLQVASGITRATPLSTGNIAVIFFGNVYVVEVPTDLSSGTIGFNPVTTGGGYDNALLFGRDVGAGHIIALKAGSPITAEVWDAVSRGTLAAPTFAGTVPNMIGGLVLWTGNTSTDALKGQLVVQSYTDATHSKLYLVNVDSPAITHLTATVDLGAPNLETVNP